MPLGLQDSYMYVHVKSGKVALKSCVRGRTIASSPIGQILTALTLHISIISPVQSFVLMFTFCHDNVQLCNEIKSSKFWRKFNASLLYSILLINDITKHKKAR